MDIDKVKKTEIKLYLEEIVHFTPLHHYFTTSGLLCCPSSREIFLH